MKTTYTIFTLLIITFFSYSQNNISGLIEYKVNVLRNPSLTEELKKDMPDVYSQFKEADSLVNSDIIFSLKIDDKESLFSPIKNLDSTPGEISPIDVAIGKSKADHIYYFNRVKFLAIKEFDFWFQHILIEDDIVEQNWELTEETKIIEGFTCYKAEIVFDNGGYVDKNIRDITAWYTPEINVTSGPLNYGGLPGLILRLDTHEHSYYASKVDLNSSDVEIIIPSKGEKMSRLAFEKNKKRIINEGKDLIVNGKK